MDNERTERIDDQQSCKIGISQKNKWSGEIKVYASTIEDAMKLALAKAKELDMIIGEKNGK